MLTLITLHLRHKWAVLRADHLSALKHMEAIVAINLQTLSTAIGDVTDLVTANQAALAAAQSDLANAQASEAADQATVDALAAKLAAILPPPAPTA